MIIFLILLLVTSCQTREFDVIKMVHNGDVKEVENNLYYYLTKVHGFQLVYENGSELECVKQLISEPEYDDSKEVVRSKLLFLSIYIDDSYLYIKSALIIDKLKMKKDSAGMKDRNVKKSSKDLKGLKIESEDAKVVIDLMSMLAHSLSIPLKFSESLDVDLDEKIQEKLTFSFIKGRR